MRDRRRRTGRGNIMATTPCMKRVLGGKRRAEIRLAELKAAGPGSSATGSATTCTRTRATCATRGARGKGRMCRSDLL